jgi:hypothetical protein
VVSVETWLLPVAGLAVLLMVGMWYVQARRWWRSEVEAAARSREGKAMTVEEMAVALFAQCLHEVRDVEEATVLFLRRWREGTQRLLEAVRSERWPDDEV